MSMDTRVFKRWLADGESWIGVFENIDLGHPDLGLRIARVFDLSEIDKADIGRTRAPDHASIGLGWRYALIAVCYTVEEACEKMEERRVM